MKGATSASFVTVGEGGVVSSSTSVPDEVPVAIVYNGTTYAVMMATPDNLEDFARGFTMTEGVATPDQIEELDVVYHPDGMELRMWLPHDHAEGITARRRAMAGPVGCGLCGIDGLAQVKRDLPRCPGTPPIAHHSIQDAMTALRQGQKLQDETRAVHAAGLFDVSSGTITLREDVGRHNALDKLIGAVGSLGHGVAVLTSRISVEMVQKTVMGGGSVLASVSAPTRLAIDTAEAAGLTLIARARGKTFDIYTHPHRILTETANVG